MSLVFAAILPHGPDIVPEITSDLAMMAETRGAMEHAPERFAAARVDTLILLDPDLVHRQSESATRTLYTGEPIIIVASTTREPALGEGSERVGNASIQSRWGRADGAFASTRMRPSTSSRETGRRSRKVG